LAGEVILQGTRFIILGKTKIQPTGKDKTSLLITNIPNEPGALIRLFEPFQRHQINMSLPVLRPTKQEAWSYVFYLEVTGHEQDPALDAALQELREFARVKVLGSYPLMASVC
jgi:chorismate mutase/prephenate dehydratase